MYNNREYNFYIQHNTYMNTENNKEITKNQMNDFVLDVLPKRSKTDGVYTATFGQTGDNRNGNRINWEGLDLTSYKNNPQMFYNHWDPIGKTMSMRHNGEGVFSVSFVFSDNEKGRETEKRWVNREINAFSTGIISESKDYNEQENVFDVGGRIEMVENSMVDVPAYASGVAVNKKNESENETGKHKTILYYQLHTEEQDAITMNTINNSINEGVKKVVDAKFNEIKNVVENKVENKTQRVNNERGIDTVATKKNKGFAIDKKNINNRKQRNHANKIIRLALNQISKNIKGNNSD